MASHGKHRGSSGSLGARLGAFASAALVLIAAAPLSAQNAIGFSPDATAELGSGPTAVVADHDVAHANAAGGVTGFLLPPGTLPANVEVAGYAPLPNGNVLLAVDTITALPGLPAGSPAEPRDVVEFAPATGLFSVYFDGAAAGVPAGAAIDAVSVDSALDLQLSFDTTVALPGSNAVDDEDVVEFSSGAFSLVFDGSAAGVANALDLDAVDLLTAPAGWLISFDTSGNVGGVVFDDEDVLRYDTGTNTYTMYFDASLSDPVDWPAADLVAVPEPATPLGLLAGALVLWACARAKRRR